MPEAREALVLGEALDAHRAGECFAEAAECRSLLVLLAVRPQRSANNQTDYGIAPQQ